MGGSPFFARIKADVLAIARAVPKGRVTSFGSIGAHLEVMPRHVAYILATLEPSEEAQTPWYRVVGEGGALGKRKENAFGIAQAELLAEEGVVILRGAVLAFDERFIDAGRLKSGVPAQKRPSDAPSSVARKRKR